MIYIFGANTSVFKRPRCRRLLLRYSAAVGVDGVMKSGRATDRSTRLGHAQRRAEEVALLVAGEMGVEGFQVFVSASDDPPGSAHTTPEVRLIEVAISTVEYPDPRVLRGTLAHELAHIRLGVPRWERYVGASGILAAALGAAGGLLLSNLFLAIAAAPHTNVLLAQVVCAAYGAGALVWASKLVHRQLLQRLELRCDIEAAHRAGDAWLALEELDPSTELSPSALFFQSTHPSAVVRAAAIRLHARYRHCACGSADPGQGE